MSRGRLSAAVSLAGLAALVLAVAWWWLVYSRVMNGSYLTFGEAAPCLVRGSDLCQLAQALCRTDHILGIRSYSTGLLWAGLALTGFGAVLAAGRES